MLKPKLPRANSLIVGLSVVGLGLLIWASTFSASYEVCETDRRGSHPKQTSFFPEIPYFFVCEGVAAGDNAELLTALGTVAIAIFTLTLWLVTNKSVKVARDQFEFERQAFRGSMEATLAQIELAREEFTTAHRPKIRVRHLWLKDSIQSGKPVSATLVLANVGDCPAIIQTIGFEFNVISVGGVLPGGLKHYPSVVWRESNLLGLGQSAEFPVESRDFHPQHFETVVVSRSKRLYCFGFVEYVDNGPPETRKIRRTEFCRELRFPNDSIEGHGRFFRLEKPDEDYEYED